MGYLDKKRGRTRSRLTRRESENRELAADEREAMQGFSAPSELPAVAKQLSAFDRYESMVFALSPSVSGCVLARQGV
jgi:hypothetical protein